MRFIIPFILAFNSIAFGQHTIGTIQYDPGAFDGYTMLNPLAYDTAYIINNCGEVINQWTSAYQNGMFAQVTKNGTLYKSGISVNNTSIQAGGASGILQEFDWNNNLLWEYEIADSNSRLHHDVEILPNGNLLGIVWERKDSLACVNAGRNPVNLSKNGMWFTGVLEIKPLYPDSAEIVWEWHAWDHLVQDYDSNRLNFGDISVSKGLLDINHNDKLSPDWAHVNGIDYNVQLDQIVMSSPMFNELWIIDHSTSSIEAASDTGGLSNKGGKLLWRWGNPATYGEGQSNDQRLFFQHDCQWVTEGSRFVNQISVFSNRDTISGHLGSIVKVLNTNYDSLNHSYPLTNDNTYYPNNPSFSYGLVDSLFAPRVSGLQFLPNDNVLICSGTNGHLIEIDSANNYVWQYVLPINAIGNIQNQGTYIPSRTNLFNVKRYDKNFVGFNGLPINPGNPIELNPLPCYLLTDYNEIVTEEVTIYPNPVTQFINVQTNNSTVQQIAIFNQFGQVMMKTQFTNQLSLDCSSWSSGIYFVRIGQNSVYKVVK
jgi:hypothetical protein